MNKLLVFQNIEQMIKQTIAKIRNNKIFKFLMDIYEELDRTHIFLFSSGISFNILLYILPLILLVIYVITLFFEFELTLNLIYNLINDFLPKNLNKKEIIVKFENEIKILFENRTIFGVIGFGTLILLSSTLISSIRYCLNLVFDIKEFKLGIIYLIRDILITLLFTVLILGYVFLMPIINYILDLINYIAPAEIQGIISSVFIYLMSIIFELIFYLFVYVIIPSGKTNYKLATLSTLVAVFFIEGFRFLFSFYFANFNNYGKIYGSLNVVLGLALWLYYSSVIMLFSGMLSKLILRRFKLQLK